MKAFYASFTIDAAALGKLKEVYKMAEITYNDLIPGKDIYAPTLIDNVVNKMGWKVSCNMFKSESLYTADRKAPFSAYVRGGIEAEAGGHY